MTLRTFMRSRLMAMEAPPILNTHLTTARASAASWLAVAARMALPKWFDGKIHYIIEIHYFMSTFLPFSFLLQYILRFHGFHFWIVHNLEIAFYFLSSQEFAPSSLGQRRGRMASWLAVAVAAWAALPYQNDLTENCKNSWLHSSHHWNTRQLFFLFLAFCEIYVGLKGFIFELYII